MNRPKTIITDIDGTLIKHCGDILKQHLIKPNLLSGVKEKLREWDIKGYKIILVTGRRESTRKATEEQLSKAGIIYDQLIMGLTGGERILINDRKINKIEDTATAINITRNKGLKNVKI